MSHGRVAAFDDVRGWGTVQADDGEELFFHCTAVADGSRRIAAGTPVTYRRAPGHLGQWEATGLEPRTAD